MKQPEDSSMAEATRVMILLEARSVVEEEIEKLLDIALDVSSLREDIILSRQVHALQSCANTLTELIGA